MITPTVESCDTKCYISQEDGPSVDIRAHYSFYEVYVRQGSVGGYASMRRFSAAFKPSLLQMTGGPSFSARHKVCQAESKGPKPPHRAASRKARPFGASKRGEQLLSGMCR